MNEYFSAVLVAGGSSARMGGSRSKVLLDLGGRPVLAWSLETLLASPAVREVCLVCREAEMDEISRLAADLLAQRGQGQTLSLALAGEDRQASVWNGVAALKRDSGYILIHDGARPLLSGNTLEAVCRDALEYGAATAAVASKDTCKLADEAGFVESTPDRSRLMMVQTPQAFRRELYLYAAEKARARGQSYTDDCQLVEAAGARVWLTQGEYANIKITTPEDMLCARAMVERREKSMRIGSGYDVHRLIEGRDLILGGEHIPFEKGLLGHSDADVLTHAVMDALLGGAALGDIGHLFPDRDPQYQGADSLELLSEVCRVVGEAGYQIGNIDATVMAQRPKLAPHIPQMRKNLAKACGIDVGRVSVKATTEEGLGFTGREEGMAASAMCLLQSS